MTVEHRTTISVRDLSAVVIPCDCGASTELPFARGSLGPLQRDAFQCPSCQKELWNRDPGFSAFVVELIRAWESGNPIRLVLKSGSEGSARGADPSS